MDYSSVLPSEIQTSQFEPSNQRVFVCTFQPTTLHHAPCVPIIAINLCRVKAKLRRVGVFFAGYFSAKRQSCLI